MVRQFKSNAMLRKELEDLDVLLKAEGVSEDDTKPLEASKARQVYNSVRDDNKAVLIEYASLVMANGDYIALDSEKVSNAVQELDAVSKTDDAVLMADIVLLLSALTPIVVGESVLSIERYADIITEIYGG